MFDLAAAVAAAEEAVDALARGLEPDVVPASKLVTAPPLGRGLVAVSGVGVDGRMTTV